MIGALATRLRRDHRGSLAIELALATPLLVGLILAVVDFSRFVLINQKVERSSATVADLVSRSQFVSEASLQTMMETSATVMEPFAVQARGRVIVSNISTTGGNAPIINWQRSYGNGTGLSEFGKEGQTPTLPDGFTVTSGDSLIVCETFFDYEPLFVSEFFEKDTLYQFTVFRPRFAALTAVVQ